MNHRVCTGVHTVDSHGCGNSGERMRGPGVGPLWSEGPEFKALLPPHALKALGASQPLPLGASLAPVRTSGAWLREGPRVMAGRSRAPTTTPSLLGAADPGQAGQLAPAACLWQQGPHNWPHFPFCSGQRETEVQLGLRFHGGLGFVLLPPWMLSPGQMVGSSYLSILGWGFPEAASCLGEPGGSPNTNRLTGRAGCETWVCQAATLSSGGRRMAAGSLRSCQAFGTEPPCSPPQPLSGLPEADARPGPQRLAHGCLGGGPVRLGCGP